MDASLYHNKRKENVVDHSSFQLVELLWLEVLRAITGSCEVVLRYQEVENGISKELKALIVINLCVKRALIFSHCVVVLLKGLVGKSLNEKGRIRESVADNILELVELMDVFLEELLVTFTLDDL